jgi:hypothetical protein
MFGIPRDPDGFPETNEAAASILKRVFGKDKDKTDDSSNETVDVDAVTSVKKGKRAEPDSPVPILTSDLLGEVVSVIARHEASAAQSTKLVNGFGTAFKSLLSLSLTCRELFEGVLHADAEPWRMLLWGLGRRGDDHCRDSEEALYRCSLKIVSQRRALELVCLTGCECCYAPRIRKVAWHFKTRVCKECMYKNTISDYRLGSDHNLKATALLALPHTTVDSYRPSFGSFTQQFFWRAEPAILRMLHTSYRNSSTQHELQLLPALPPKLDLDMLEHTTTTFADDLYGAFSKRASDRAYVVSTELKEKQLAAEKAAQEVKERADAIINALIDATTEHIQMMVPPGLYTLVSDRNVLLQCIECMNLEGVAKRVTRVEDWIAQRVPDVATAALECIAMRVALAYIIPPSHIPESTKTKLLGDNVNPTAYYVLRFRLDHPLDSARVDAAVAAMIGSTGELVDAFLDADAFGRLVEPMLPPPPPPRSLPYRTDSGYFRCPKCIGSTRMFLAHALIHHDAAKHKQ